MTDFKTFLENADSAALRQSQIARSKEEANAREKNASEFTTNSRKKSQEKRSLSQERLKRQKEKTKEYIDTQSHKKQVSREKIAQNADNVKTAAKGVVKVGKSVVGYARDKITNR